MTAACETIQDSLQSSRMNQGMRKIIDKEALKLTTTKFKKRNSFGRCIKQVQKVMAKLKSAASLSKARVRLPARMILRIGCDNETCKASLGDKFQCDPKTVRKYERSVAQANATAQELLLLNIIERLERRRPHWGLGTPLCDEASHKLKIAVPIKREGENNLKGRTVKLVQQVMKCFVNMCDFAWGWGSEDDCESEWVRVVFPPVPIASTSADAMWDTIENHPFCSYVITFRNKLFELATSISMQCSCRDRAGGNIKLRAYEELVLPSSIYLHGFDCFNHQCMLGECDVSIVTFTTAYLHNTYAICNFMNMGCHRLRCLTVIRSCVHDFLDLGFGYADESDVAYAEVLQAVLLHWNRKMAPARFEGRQTTAPATLVRPPPNCVTLHSAHPDADPGLRPAPKAPILARGRGGSGRRW